MPAHGFSEQCYRCDFCNEHNDDESHWEVVNCTQGVESYCRKKIISKTAQVEFFVCVCNSVSDDIINRGCEVATEEAKLKCQTNDYEDIMCLCNGNLCNEGHRTTAASLSGCALLAASLVVINDWTAFCSL